MNHTLFISDLHLQPNRPDITANFLRFLEQHAPKADALYILGDLFEAWVGMDDTPLFHQTIQSALLALTNQGVAVYFMRGNRDFLIDQSFAQATGCQILPDPTLIQLYNNSIILTHGDLLCLQDKKHQLFRKITQNTQYHGVFLKLPLWIRRKAARFLRKASRKHTDKLSYSALDVDETAVIQLMSKHGAYQMIHGHTHRPAIHDLFVDNRSAHRIVLGDWDPHANGLMYDATSYYQLIHLK